MTLLILLIKQEMLMHVPLEENKGCEGKVQGETDQLSL